MEICKFLDDGFCKFYGDVCEGHPSCNGIEEVEEIDDFDEEKFRFEWGRFK